MLVMLTPFFVVYSILGGSGPLVPLVGVAWCVQVVLLSRALKREGACLTIPHAQIVSALVILQAFTLLMDLALGLPANFLDGVNIAVRAINFVLLLALTSQVRLHRGQVLVLMRYFLVFAVLACFYNLIANFSQLGSFASTAITSTYELNLRSIFANRNQFGSFLFLALVAQGYIAASRSTRWSDAGVFLLIVANLVLTQSRGGMIAAAIFLATLYGPKLLTGRRVFAIVPIVGIAVALTSVSRWNGILEAFDFAARPDAGVSGRDVLWKLGASIAFEHNPIIGVGLFTGLDLTDPQFTFSQFHSLYIDALVDGGFVGIVILLLILFSCARSALRNLAHRDLARVHLSALVAMLTLAAFESISFFSMGFVDTVFTVFFVSVPVLISRLASPSDGPDSSSRISACPTFTAA